MLGALLLALPASGLAATIVALSVIDATERAAEAPGVDRHPPVVEAPSLPPRPDPLRALEPPTVTWLTAGAPDAPAAFVWLPFVTPETFCQALSRAGLTGAAFRADEPPATGWTCVTDLIKPRPGAEDEVSSLFVSARGLTADKLDVIRFKLNLLDPAGVRQVKRLARESLRQVFKLLGFVAEEAPLAAIEELRELRFDRKGVVYEVRREFGTPLRVNVIVTFPRTLGGPRVGAFTRTRRGLAAPIDPRDTAPERDAAAGP